MKFKDVLIFLVIIAIVIVIVLSVIKLITKDKGTRATTNPALSDDTDTGEVYIPQYLTYAEAMEIGKDLYETASLISYDPLSFKEYNFVDSDVSGYVSKITNFTFITSKYFVDPSKVNIENSLPIENGMIYVRAKLRDKRQGYIKTDLQLKQNEENYVAFNAVSYYCNKSECTEEETYTNSSNETTLFSIRKHNGKWKVDEFTLAY